MKLNTGDVYQYIGKEDGVTYHVEILVVAGTQTAYESRGPNIPGFPTPVRGIVDTASAIETLVGLGVALVARKGEPLPE